MFKLFKSSEGNVFKYVFTGDDYVAEAVLYKYDNSYKRTVICCSTISGCNVGCKFCGTGNKFIRNLKAKEIVIQVTPNTRGLKQCPICKGKRKQ